MASERLKNLAMQTAEIYYVAPDQRLPDGRFLIVPDPNNLRGFNPETDPEDATFLEIIRNEGVLDPIEFQIKDGQRVTVEGYRRLSAALALRAEGNEIYVPIKHEPKGRSDVDRMVRALTSDGRRKTPLQYATGIKRLIDYGVPRQEIAKRLGVHIATVDNALDMLSLPPEAKEMVEEGKIGAMLAVKTIRREGETQGAEVLHEAKVRAEEQGSTRVMPKHVTPRKPTVPRKAPLRVDPIREEQARTNVVSFRSGPRLDADMLKRALEAVQRAETLEDAKDIAGQALEGAYADDDAA